MILRKWVLSMLRVDQSEKTNSDIHLNKNQIISFHLTVPSMN